MYANRIKKNKDIFFISIIFFIFYIDPSISFLTDSGSSIIFQVFRLVASLIVIFVYSSQKFPSLNISIFIYFLFIAYTVVSSIWSGHLISGLAQSLSYLLLSIATLYIVTLINKEDLLESILFSSYIFIFLSMIFILLVPQVGVETRIQHAGAWRGLASQKNAFGFLSSIAANLSFFYIIYRKKYIHIILFAPSLLCLYYSQSLGAYISFSVILASQAILSLRIFGQYAGFIIAVALMGLSLAIVSVSEIYRGELYVLGWEVDTTNRAKIWEFAFQQIDTQRMLIGTGVDGFWDTENSYIYERKYGWVIQNFHNGYLSVFFQYGAIGLALFVAALISLIIRFRIHRIRKEGSAEIFMAGVCVSYLIAMFFEDYIGRSLGSPNLFFMIFAYSLSLTAVRRSVKYS